MYTVCRPTAMLLFIYITARVICQPIVDRNAGVDIESIGVGGGDARDDFVVGSGGDHGAVVAGELRLGEIGVF